MNDIEEFYNRIGTEDARVWYRTYDEECNYRGKMVHIKDLPADAIWIGYVDTKTTCVPENTPEFCNRMYYERYYLFHGN